MENKIMKKKINKNLKKVLTVGVEKRKQKGKVVCCVG